MNDVIRYLSFSAWLMKIFFLFFFKLFYYSYCYFIYFLATPHNMWDLGALSRDGARAPCSGSAESAPGQPGRPHEDIFDCRQLWSVTGQCASKHPTVHRIAPHSKELSKCHWCQGWKNLNSKCSYFLSSLVQMRMVRKVSPADTI